MSDAMRPSADWGAEAKEYASASGQQSILCTTCLSVSPPNTTPPTQVIVVGGFSVCLAHYPAMRDYVFSR